MPFADELVTDHGSTLSSPLFSLPSSNFTFSNLLVASIDSDAMFSVTEQRTGPINKTAGLIKQPN